MTDLSLFSSSVFWRHFGDICAIPRPSGHEQRIREHIIEFAKQHDISWEVDTIGNLLLRKAATPGYEESQGVILQGHLDMVPVKSTTSNHDFNHDPIPVLIDDDRLTANGTTLGADNGIGIAACLTLLQSIDVQHGPLEVLLTIEEESSMLGAENITADWLQGRTLLNLDTEVEGHLYAGCAGGINVTSTATYEPENSKPGYEWQTITLSGLLGGHSGLDIHLKRGNAIILMARFLKKLTSICDFQLGRFIGGTLDNVIPSSACVDIAIAPENLAVVQSLLTQFQHTIKNELGSNGKKAEMSLQSVTCNSTAIGTETRDQWLNALHACPNGAFSFNTDFGNETETSSNLGIFQLEAGKIHADCFARSMVDSETCELADRLAGLFKLIGANVAVEGFFPGWQPRSDSAVQQIMQAVYQDLFQKEPVICVIHGGLECGILTGIYPDMDMVSFGPTITGAHTPDEQVNIASVEKFMQLLKATLEHIAQQ